MAKNICPREAFLATKKRLLLIAENKHDRLLDRIDAYLELAQLYERDAHDRAVYVRHARDLIRDERIGSIR